MKIKNWLEVEPSDGNFEKLPAGGYVCRITAVEDVESKEYLRIVFDINEGEHRLHFADDFGAKNPYTHQFVRSYKDTAEGMFRAFLDALKTSNRGRFNVDAWQRTCDPQALVNMEIGLVMQYEDYTNNKGEDKRRLEVVAVIPSQDVRSGDYKLPPVKDSRTKVGGTTAAAAQTAYDDDLPF